MKEPFIRVGYSDWLAKSGSDFVSRELGVTHKGLYTPENSNFTFYFPDSREELDLWISVERKQDINYARLIKRKLKGIWIDPDEVKNLNKIDFSLHPNVSPSRVHDRSFCAGIDPFYFSITQGTTPSFDFSLPDAKYPWFVKTSVIYENGGDVVEEIAYMLVLLETYLKYQRAPVFVELATGRNFFLQIAKMRAAQILVEIFRKEYDVDICVGASIAVRTKTAYDKWANLVRETIEGLAALLAGVRILTVRAFDFLERDNENSLNLALGNQLVLAYEAQLTKLHDPLRGSYFVEYLTYSITEKAWKVAKKIVKKDLAERGLWFRKKLAGERELNNKMVDDRNTLIVAINRFPHASDTLESLPYSPYRDSLIVEKIRFQIAQEFNTEKVKLFLVYTKDKKGFRDEALQIKEFFGVLGLDVEELDFSKIDVIDSYKGKKKIIVFLPFPEYKVDLPPNCLTAGTFSGADIELNFEEPISVFANKVFNALRCSYGS